MKMIKTRDPLMDLPFRPKISLVMKGRSDFKSEVKERKQQNAFNDIYRSMKANEFPSETWFINFDNNKSPEATGNP